MRVSKLLKSRRARWIALAALVALTMPLVWLYRQVDARAQMDNARQADVIIVLGSAVYPGGRPSPSLRARTLRAVELYRAGYAPNLILTGGVGGHPPSEARVMAQVARDAGVPETALVLEERATSTEENIVFSKRIMDARGWKSALIVSDPYHLFRAETIARDAGLPAAGVGARNSPLYAAPVSRVWYTAREALALTWYYATRGVGEPAWLYAVLKGRL